MRILKKSPLHSLGALCLCAGGIWAQQPAPATAPAAAPAGAPAGGRGRGGRGANAPRPDSIATPFVKRLDLDRYKATIKGLTQFGDRRQGTDRNRAAIDWIEAQLKSYGCTNTERIHYVYPTPPGQAAASDPATAGARGIRRGVIGTDTVNNDPMKQPDEKLRALDSQPTTPGPREEVYCTKIGSTHPEEMYIVGGHRIAAGLRLVPGAEMARHDSA
jgi:hypothetical protein